MKLFDYIFYPDPTANGEWSVQGMDLENESVERMQGPLACLTLEELRECFEWGMSSAEDTQTPDLSFKDFLESKGINKP